MAARGLPFIFDDGGRAAAGFKGDTRDCVTRALAIVTGSDYRTIYDEVNEAALAERPRNGASRSNARLGVHKGTTRRLMAAHGGIWTPTMSIGSGTTVHLAEGELPAGRIVANCSRHVVAVIDGTVHDTYDPSRDGTRAVYGYWQFGEVS